MQKIISFTTLLLFLLFQNLSQAQTQVFKDSIESSILHETRTYSIQIPKNYNASKNYPVIYVLDGEMYFPIVTAVNDFLNRNKRFSSHECIVVAINNTDRTRDLTPTAAISTKGHGTLDNSGKGEAFYQFISKELMPSIQKNYATSNQKILIGHSFGGLAATYVLLTHPNTFSDYLIMEPSLWWDDQKLLQSADHSLQTNQYNANTRVFFAFARKETSNPNNIEQLVAKDQPSIGLKYKYYPEENHGSVYLPALYDGLRFLLEIKFEKHVSK